MRAEALFVCVFACASNVLLCMQVSLLQQGNRYSIAEAPMRSEIFFPFVLHTVNFNGEGFCRNFFFRIIDSFA